jgi:hypothetical protein
MMGATSFVNVTWRAAGFAGACAARACVITTAAAAMLAATQLLLRALIGVPFLKNNAVSARQLHDTLAYTAYACWNAGIQMILM